MKPPHIGITGSPRSTHLLKTRDLLNRNAYFNAIRMVGGQPASIRSAPCIEPTRNDPNHFDGILFTGGGDINPVRYGAKKAHALIEVDDERDVIEFAWFRLALESNIPFLGICRGCQLVNVGLGGDLYQDLGAEAPNLLEHNWAPSRIYPAHEIVTYHGDYLSKLGFLTGQSVNSLHHQGIRTIGNDLSIMATAKDGLPEAMRLTGHPFGMAVQWHPEWLVNQKTNFSLFLSFINACTRD